MAKIKGQALTENGVVKTQVRQAIATSEITKIESAIANNGYEKLEGKNVLVKEYASENGSVYVALTMTISEKDPLTKAPKKKSSKKQNNDTFVIEG